MVSISEEWSVLGPFQIGTREAAWGADSLEYYGGFPSLQPNDDTSYKSSLAPNGSVKWSSVNASSGETSKSGAKASLTIDFDAVDWQILQKIYGWSAFQWQGWARGEIYVDGHESVRVAIYTDQVLEYALDGERSFGGDFYGFRRAPHVLTLTPGKHVLDLRIVRDTRGMGGVGEPNVDVQIELRICEAPVELVPESILISDVLGERLASPYVAVDMRNNGEQWIEVVGIAHNFDESNGFAAATLMNEGAVIAPGQTRPTVIKIHQHSPLASANETLDLKIAYRPRGSHDSSTELPLSLPLKRKRQSDAHKFTYLHPSNIVSYSILRAPINATCPTPHQQHGAPVMLQLHGAGVDADSDMMYDVINSFPTDLCAWLLFPSGVTPWCGDDWHTWGSADVLAAVEALPSWIETIGWTGVGVNTDKWFVGGHSNGGQGAWYTLLHNPDKVFAASAVSGYSSILEYVPYKFWRPVEPAKKAIVEASLNSFRHELLVGNAKGIPVIMQHGSADDNVPAYHARLMNQMLSEGGVDATYVSASLSL